MARLFEQCEWTQEKIAERMGKKQVWVSQRLCFGRFLNFIATGDNRQSQAGQLTERRFRELWKRTKGKEPDRFRQVADALANGIPQGAAALVDKPGVRKAVLEVLADGKAYTARESRPRGRAGRAVRSPGMVRGAIGRYAGDAAGGVINRRESRCRRPGVNLGLRVGDSGPPYNPR